MEIGEKIYIKTEKIYGKDQTVYKEGIIIAKYPTYILVRFDCRNNGSYKEAFNLYGLEYKKELEENDRLF